MFSHKDTKNTKFWENLFVHFVPLWENIKNGWKNTVNKCFSHKDTKNTKFLGKFLCALCAFVGNIKKWLEEYCE